MKKTFTIPKSLFLMCLIALGSLSIAMAQDEIVVEQGADLFTVISDVMDDDGMLSSHVFVLKRGSVYFMSQSIFTNDHITLRGEEGDETVRPAMVIPKAAPDGNYVGSWFTLEGMGKTFEASNVIFQMLTLQAMATGLNVNTLVIGSADNQRIILDRCIINGNGNNTIGSVSDGQYLKITNCKFRNNRNLEDDWSGGVLYGNWSAGGWRDSLIFRNNTLINIGNGGLRCFTGETSRAVIIDHNTFFGTTRPNLYIREQSNVQVTNNMFFASNASGSPKARFSDTYEPPLPIYDSVIIGDTSIRVSSSIYNVNLLDAAAYPHVENVLGFDISGDLESIEEQRTFIIKNNCAYWPPELVVAWDTLDEDGGKQAPQIRMSDYTDWLFQNQINSVVENTYGHEGSEDALTSDFDPGYDQATVERVMTPMNTWIDGFRNEDGWVPFMCNIDDPGKEIQLAWPLPENLAYTNEDLITGGTDGLPVGDLNWFPNATPSGINAPLSFTGLSLEGYPNPFNGDVNISFRLMASSRVRMSVLDITGKEIVILMDEFRMAGENEIVWNGSGAVSGDLPSGIYFTKVETIEGADVIKLIKY